MFITAQTSVCSSHRRDLSSALFEEASREQAENRESGAGYSDNDNNVIESGVESNPQTPRIGSEAAMRTQETIMDQYKEQYLCCCVRSNGSRWPAGRRIYNALSESNRLAAACLMISVVLAILFIVWLLTGGLPVRIKNDAMDSWLADEKDEDGNVVNEAKLTPLVRKANSLLDTFKEAPLTPLVRKANSLLDKADSTFDTTGATCTVSAADSTPLSATTVPEKSPAWIDGDTATHIAANCPGYFTAPGGPVDQKVGRAVDQAVERVGAELDRRVERVGVELDRRVETVGAELDRRVERVGAELDRRFERVGAELDRRVAPVVEDLVATREHIHLVIDWWRQQDPYLVGGWVTLVIFVSLVVVLPLILLHIRAPSIPGVTLVVLCSAVAAWFLRQPADFRALLAHVFRRRAA